METSLLLLTTRTLSGRSNRYFGNVDKRLRLERKKNEARLDYNPLFKPDRESEMHIVQLFPIPEDIFHLLGFHLNLSYNLQPAFLTR